jgi:hypothetical protein
MTNKFKYFDVILIVLMSNIFNRNYKLLGLPLVILLIITIFGNSFINSAYASHNTVKVNCKDLAIALITWDQLLRVADDEDIVDIEHLLADEDVSQVLLKVLIDRHLDDLLDESQDECNNLDDDIERVLGDIDFALP